MSLRLQQLSLKFKEGNISDGGERERVKPALFQIHNNQ